MYICTDRQKVRLYKRCANQLVANRCPLSTLTNLNCPPFISFRHSFTHTWHTVHFLLRRSRALAACCWLVGRLALGWLFDRSVRLSARLACCLCCRLAFVSVEANALGFYLLLFAWHTYVWMYVCVCVCFCTAPNFHLQRHPAYALTTSVGPTQARRNYSQSLNPQGFPLLHN